MQHKFPAGGMSAPRPVRDIPRRRRQDELPSPPIRGVPGGWVDPWEENPVAAARAEVAEMARWIRAERRRVRQNRACRSPASQPALLRT